VILVPMLVFNNYFINPGLAELWWILAGLLFAATDSLGAASARLVHQKRAWTSRTS
jgi:hypothetical protein